MERDRDPFEAADAAEVREAAALAEALEGRGRDAEDCRGALEAAALLRFSANAGRLDRARSAEIRQELLSVAREPERGRARFSWLWAWLPAASVAAVAVALGARALLSDEAARTQPAAPGSELRAAAEAKEGRQEMAAPAGDGSDLGEVAQAAREYRAALLGSLDSPDLEGAHARLEAASSAAELAALHRSIEDVVDARAERWSPERTQLVRQDVFCRLAETALRLGQPHQALEWTRRGLELDGAPNPLIAQLNAVEGHARASLGDQLGAAKSYLQAMEINETLLREHLDGP